MATVYLAHDIKHDRDVAIKVLHPELGAALGSERFLTEIRTTARLQHPHILPLLDSGDAGGLLYFVMPLVSGETLRARLQRERQLPIDDALKIAREVSDALGYAHGLGVIHRDIKPENILLQNGHAVVADFGIALAVQSAGGARMTQTGLSLGTPQYMSPEQAMGERTIDARSDVYALGAVVYEMLTGDPPFTGSSVQAIVAKVLTERPSPPSTVRDTVSASVELAVLKALAKLPADRFENAKAFGDALGNTGVAFGTDRAPATLVTRSARRWKLAAIATGLVAGTLGALLLLSAWRARTPADTGTRDPIRFLLSDDPSLRVDVSFTHPFAVSPDGRRVVFRAATDSTTTQLWIRTLDTPGARPLPGTENGANAAFSADGKWIGFITDLRVVKKVRAEGGAVTTLGQIDGLSAGLAWSSDTLILIEQIGTDGGTQRVNAGGGRLELAIPIDTPAGEYRQRRPMVLSGTDIVVYGSSTKQGEEIVMYRMTDGKRARLGLKGHGALAMIDDHLVYAQSDGTLMAVEIDPRRMRVRGEPMRLGTRVAWASSGTSVALSESGVLVYRPAGAAALARLDLVDMAGRVRTLHAAVPIVGWPRFSRDGGKVALGIGVDGGIRRGFRITTSDLWTIDLLTGEATRLTSNNEVARASWFPGDLRLMYLKAVVDGFEIQSHRLDGSAPPSQLVHIDATPYEAEVAADGKTLVVRTGDLTSSTGGALVRVSLDAPTRVDTLVRASGTGVRPEYPRISPDGLWVCYVDRSTYDVWVRSLRDSSTMMVSTTGSLDSPAVWGPDSRTLYYRSAAGMSVIELNTTPRISVARRRAIRGMPTNIAFDLSPDGKTFVMVTPAQSSGGAIVAVDWANEARREWSRGAKK